MFEVVFNIFSTQSSLGLDYLRPTAPLGLFILTIGLLFSSTIFYILFTLGRDSESDRQRKADFEKERINKIKRLYPPSYNGDL